MRPATAVTDGAALFELLRRLEPDSRDIPELAATPGVAGALLVALREDPGRHVIYVVATEAPSSKGDGGQRWLTERSDPLGAVAKGRKTSLCTVVFPGAWPRQQQRHRLGQTPVRMVSAVHHLWADRLGVHDDDGNVDEAQRTRLLERLSGKWLEDEERRYTDPSLDTVDGSEDSEGARAALLEPHPDIRPGSITVIYGPGGIGKTFFLRRMASQLGRDATADPTLGIPVFAALPLLLHEDALEAWLSRAGIRLPIADIEALLAAGLIVPVLDALDELVRGQAREGSRQFLQHLKHIGRPSGRVVLSSRDYYLNLDPLVRDELGTSRTAELKIGFFSRAGRRRYIQMRGGLDEKEAARWAGRLEGQAQETLGGLPEADVESLIGHPLFLDALCEIILALPANRRAAEADNFRITSPDVFGEIVQRVLVREHEKVQPGWQAKFGGTFAAPWDDPFDPDNQRGVFRHLVLLAAADGGTEVTRREAEDVSYRQLRHGVFTFTGGAPEGATPRECLKEIVSRVLGRPELLTQRSAEEDEALVTEALGDFVGSLAQHTLVDTRANLPGDLVFAARHRAYFDFLLADELLKQLQLTVSRADPAARESFIEWCLQHHIFESHDGAEAAFGTCLDFALWHRTALAEASAALDGLFDRTNPADEVLASYVVSLALAVTMRAGALTGGAVIRDRAFDPQEGFELDLVDSIVPNVANVEIRNCSFPQLGVKGITVRDTRLVDCDIGTLVFSDTSFVGVRMENIASKAIGMSGAVRISDSTLDVGGFECDSVIVEPGASVVIRNSELSEALLACLTEISQTRRESVDIRNCQPIEAPTPELLSTGRLFVNRLMTLVRKHGHDDFGVWEPKLRGLSNATANSFPRAIGVLERMGAVKHGGEMIILTPQAEANRFAGKAREGLRSYLDVAAFWDPVIAELDLVL